MDLLAWMQQWDMLPHAGETVLCALSGGRDSVCLLHYLKELAPQYGFSVAAAHFNHQLRPTADRDEMFCRKLCSDWEIPFFAGRGDVAAEAGKRGWSCEEAGRFLRYRFLEQAAVETGASRIATAHHLADQAETVVMNLLRGTGMEGLGGIPPVRGKLIRPLLQTPRREIEAYLRENGLSYVEDESNTEPCFARNRLRLKAWPELEQVHSGAAENIGRAAEILRRENDFLDTLSAAYLPESGVKIPCGTLMEAPEVLRPRILRLLLRRTGAGRKDFGAAHYAAMEKLAQSGGMLDLPGGLRCVCRGGMLELAEKEPPLAMRALEDRIYWGEYEIICRRTPGEQTEDGALIRIGEQADGTIFVRSPDSRDRLRLPGARGSRSVKRLLTERGIPAEQRSGIPVFCCGDRVAAVYGVGTDMNFLPTEDGESIDIIVKEQRRT